MNPSGSLMYLTGGLEGLAQPGLSSISTSKLAAHRLIEYVHLGESPVAYLCLLDWLLVGAHSIFVLQLRLG